jgi:hypothetical protein
MKSKIPQAAIANKWLRARCSIALRESVAFAPEVYSAAFSLIQITNVLDVESRIRQEIVWIISRALSAE